MNTIISVAERFRTQQVQWHSHEYWELFYCTGGTGAIWFENGLSLEYGEGDMLMVPPGQRHSGPVSSGVTNIHVAMTDPAVPCRNIFCIRDDSDARLRHAFTEAWYFYGSDIQKRELVLSALGDLICGYLSVLQSSEEVSEPSREIRAEIMKHYSEPDFALDAAIHAMPFHYDYLRKLFKKEVGVTPREYLTGLRMKKAEQLLGAMSAQPVSMTQIAEQCGYDDALYFSRVFKKYYNCAPSSFFRKAKYGETGSGESAEEA